MADDETNPNFYYTFSSISLRLMRRGRHELTANTPSVCFSIITDDVEKKGKNGIEATILPNENAVP